MSKVTKLFQPETVMSSIAILLKKLGFNKFEEQRIFSVLDEGDIEELKMMLGDIQNYPFYARRLKPYATQKLYLSPSIGGLAREQVVRSAQNLSQQEAEVKKNRMEQIKELFGRALSG